MADAFQQQLQTDEAAALGFEERFGLLVDVEWTAREQRKLQRCLHTAERRYRRRSNRRLHPSSPAQPPAGPDSWNLRVGRRASQLDRGRPTGIGNSFLACAFVERACRRGFTARYVRMPRARAPPRRPSPPPAPPAAPAGRRSRRRLLYATARPSDQARRAGDRRLDARAVARHRAVRRHGKLTPWRH